MNSGSVFRLGLLPAVAGHGVASRFFLGLIQGRPAATVGSTATNTPAHVPQGGTFVKPPRNQGRIVRGSATVFINRKPAARAGDKALTCNDPVDLPVGTVVARSKVLIGG
ncbi:MAG: PAAR domain-containing protein [Desulfobacterales bacterium]|nr:MAG: PAAR domain-containing protein [Desulfobacterales bacterium]